MWLLDFVSLMFKNLDEKREMSLSHIAKDAYTQTLGTHHPWVVRQAAKVAMIAIPARDTLVQATGLTYEHCR